MVKAWKLPLTLKGMYSFLSSVAILLHRKKKMHVDIIPRLKTNKQCIAYNLHPFYIFIGILIHFDKIIIV